MESTGRHTSPRRARAEELKQAAEALIRFAGRHVELGGIRVVQWESGKFLIVLTTPFSRVPGASHEVKYVAALTGTTDSLDENYGLDIWLNWRKVLSLWWADGRPFTIVNFKRGDWEHRLLQFADRCSRRVE